MASLIGRCGGGGGGGITTPQTEVFTTEANSIAAGATKNYGWTHLQGETLMSGTVPLVDGVYSMLVRADAISSTAFTAGRGFWISALMNDGASGFQNIQQAMILPTGAFLNGARISGSCSLFVPAATGSVSFAVTNTDTGAHTINMQAFISRIG